jgi:AcrR family transcriptional regulator
MARPRASDYDAQRERILELAVSAFARIGYPSASMAMLAQACGTSKAGLYHYFDSKQSMLFEALDRYTKRLHETVKAVDVHLLSPQAALAQTVRALMQEYRHSHAYHAALLNDVKFLAPDQAATIRRQERAVVDRIATVLEAAAPGRIESSHRTVVTMALLGMINFTFAWLKPGGAVSHDAFAELASELWLRGLEGLDPSKFRAMPKLHDDIHSGSIHEQAVRLQS